MTWSLLASIVASAACATGNDNPATTGTGGTTATTGTGGTTGTTGTGGTTGTTGTGGTTSTTGTGGTIAGTDAGTTGPSVCDGAGTRALTTDDVKVDNFEDTMLSLGWSSFNDIKGAPDSIKIAQVTGGAVGTAHAGKYTGMGATPSTKGGYGVGTVYNMAIDKTAGIYCVDISVFDGVTFWAKANQPVSLTNTNKVAVNFVLPDTNAVSVGGDCVDATNKCYNHPRQTITLTSDWAQYSVKFADATGGSAKVKNRLQELAFLAPDADWDFSIDEIQLYKGTAPTGPVPTKAP